MSTSTLLERLRDSGPDFSKDARLNLNAVLSGESTPGLTPTQMVGVTLASAYSTKHTELIEALKSDLKPTDEVLHAAKGAATLMAMNNVYYRFLHLSENKEFSSMPAKLRMNLLAQPGVPKVEFELMSLAVSALNGCGSCINAHVHEAKKAGITNEGIQSVIRIASIVNSASQALSIP